MGQGISQELTHEPYSQPEFWNHRSKLLRESLRFLGSQDSSRATSLLGQDIFIVNLTKSRITQETCVGVCLCGFFQRGLTEEKRYTLNIGWNWTGKKKKSTSIHLSLSLTDGCDRPSDTPAAIMDCISSQSLSQVNPLFLSLLLSGILS